jgi:hypothetical protein
MGQEGADAKKAYEALVAEHTAAMEAYSAAMQKVAATEEYKELRRKLGQRDLDETTRQELMEKMTTLRASVPAPDAKAFTARFQEGAETYAGTKGAVPFLVWVATRGERDARDGAIDTLATSHAESAEISDFIDFLGFASRAGIPVEKVRGVAGVIAEKNPDPELKAAALYARAQTYLGTGRDAKPVAEFAEAYEKDLAKALEVAPDSLTAMRIHAPKFQATRLQIGMTVPDIEGEDLDGVPFKLSDYRGKVVVLDFWGDW